MFFDMQEYCCVTGMFAFPEFPFGDLPKQPSQIVQDPYIQGSTTGGRVLDIQGSAGDFPG
jgi:hypothetical protein